MLQLTVTAMEDGQPLYLLSSNTGIAVVTTLWGKITGVKGTWGNALQLVIWKAMVFLAWITVNNPSVTWTSHEINEPNEFNHVQSVWHLLTCTTTWHVIHQFWNMKFGAMATSLTLDGCIQCQSGGNYVKSEISTAVRHTFRLSRRVWAELRDPH